MGIGLADSSATRKVPVSYSVFKTDREAHIAAARAANISMPKAKASTGTLGLSGQQRRVSITLNVG